MAQTTMPEISVLEILEFDDDGNGYARPVDDDAADIDICVLLSRRKAALQLSDSKYWRGLRKLAWPL